VEAARLLYLDVKKLAKVRGIGHLHVCVDDCTRSTTRPHTAAGRRNRT
jgi:hypothetical protein